MKTLVAVLLLLSSIFAQGRVTVAVRAVDDALMRCSMFHVTVAGPVSNTAIVLVFVNGRPTTVTPGSLHSYLIQELPYSNSLSLFDFQFFAPAIQSQATSIPMYHPGCFNPTGQPSFVTYAWSNNGSISGPGSSALAHRGRIAAHVEPLGRGATSGQDQFIIAGEQRLAGLPACVLVSAGLNTSTPLVFDSSELPTILPTGAWFDFPILLDSQGGRTLLVPTFPAFDYYVQAISLNQSSRALESSSYLIHH
jgi:hypothetical protein